MQRGFEQERAKIFTRTGVEPEVNENDLSLVEVSLFELLAAFTKVLKSLPQDTSHEIIKDEYTVAEKVHQIFHVLAKQASVRFSALFHGVRNKAEVIATFLALLELVRMREVIARQDAHFEEIEISRNPKRMEPIQGVTNG